MGEQRKQRIQSAFEATRKLSFVFRGTEGDPDRILALKDEPLLERFLGFLKEKNAPADGTVHVPVFLHPGSDGSGLGEFAAVALVLSAIDLVHRELSDDATFDFVKQLEQGDQVRYKDGRRLRDAIVQRPLENGMIVLSVFFNGRNKAPAEQGCSRNMWSNIVPNTRWERTRQAADARSRFFGEIFGVDPSVVPVVVNGASVLCSKPDLVPTLVDTLFLRTENGTEIAFRDLIGVGFEDGDRRLTSRWRDHGEHALRIAKTPGEAERFAGNSSDLLFLGDAVVSSAPDRDCLSRVVRKAGRPLFLGSVGSRSTKDLVEALERNLPHEGATVVSCDVLACTRARLSGVSVGTDPVLKLLAERAGNRRFEVREVEEPRMSADAWTAFCGHVAALALQPAGTERDDCLARIGFLRKCLFSSAAPVDRIDALRGRDGKPTLREIAAGLPDCWPYAPSGISETLRAVSSFFTDWLDRVSGTANGKLEAVLADAGGRPENKDDCLYLPGPLFSDAVDEELAARRADCPASGVFRLRPVSRRVLRTRLFRASSFERSFSSGRPAKAVFTAETALSLARKADDGRLVFLSYSFEKESVAAFADHLRKEADWQESWYDARMGLSRPAVPAEPVPETEGPETAAGTEAADSAPPPTLDDILDSVSIANIPPRTRKDLGDDLDDEPDESDEEIEEENPRPPTAAAPDRYYAVFEDETTGIRYEAVLSRGKKLYVLDDKSDEDPSRPVDGLSAGTLIVRFAAGKTASLLIDALLDCKIRRDKERTPDEGRRLEEAREKAKGWLEELRTAVNAGYRRGIDSYFQERLRPMAREKGLQFVELQAVKRWLESDDIVGPRDEDSFRVLGWTLPNLEMAQNPGLWFEACRLVRSTRIRLRHRLFDLYRGIGSVDFGDDRLLRDTLASCGKVLRLVRIEPARPEWCGNLPVDAIRRWTRGAYGPRPVQGTLFERN